MSMKYGFFFYFLIFSFGFAENLDEKIEKFILDNPEVILNLLKIMKRKRKVTSDQKIKKKLTKRRNLFLILTMDYIWEIQMQKK